MTASHALSQLSYSPEGMWGWRGAGLLFGVDGFDCYSAHMDFIDN
jgi:hypothetical protein